MNIVFLNLTLDSYHGYSLNRNSQNDWRHRVGSNPYIAPSYIQGTSPASGYALPPFPWRIHVDNAINNHYAAKQENLVRVKEQHLHISNDLTLGFSTRCLFCAPELLLLGTGGI